MKIDRLKFRRLERPDFLDENFMPVYNLLAYSMRTLFLLYKAL